MDHPELERKNNTTPYVLPWGQDQLSLSLPPEWNVAGYLKPASIPAVLDVEGEVNQSLAQPIGSSRLGALYHHGMKVVVVIDDISRPTPVQTLLSPVFAELDRAGLLKESLTLVTALGVHRPMTEQEIARRIGRSTMEGLKWENTDCDDLDKLRKLGTTQRGTPVWINRTVAEADLVISLGCIEPHIIASFGGGYKNLVPGVSGRATIAHNHTINCTPDTFNMVGQPIDRNPMRQDLEEAAQMLKARVFIVNAVLNSALQVVRVVAGDPVAAHREGIRTSTSLYGVLVKEQADIVIANSHPMNSDLRQGVKALANSIRAVRPGGVMITLVKADEGVGVFGLANRKLPLSRGGLKKLAPLLLRLVPRINLRGMGEEDRFFLYFALQAMRLADLRMVAATIPAAVKANLPFVTFDENLETAVEQARRCFPGPASVLIFPHGGTTYPYFKD